ncbi:MAG: DUF1906 domain-containing protein [Thaumarchaeota archaeon]|nr:DUF1906 domain-containing protein [Nitrososphaerota archaeon]
MQNCWDTKNYFFVGYYLPRAPNVFSNSWRGKRKFLKSIGWGFAVIYVGQLLKKYNGIQTNLTKSQGFQDGKNAEQIAMNEGFPSGTTIFLDVENYADHNSKSKTPKIDPSTKNYVEGWIEYFVKNNYYVPGLYCYLLYSDELYNLSQSVYRSNNQSGAAKIWIFYTGSINHGVTKITFNLTTSPTVARPFAEIWQGQQNVQVQCPCPIQSGNFLTVDLDTAVNQNPSNG